MKPNSSFRQGLNFGFRLGMELVVATGVGGLMGFALDTITGARPWFLALGLLFGGAAGCLNVYRAAMEYQKQTREEEKPGPDPSDKTDELLK